MPKQYILIILYSILNLNPIMAQELVIDDFQYGDIIKYGDNGNFYISGTTLENNDSKAYLIKFNSKNEKKWIFELGDFKSNRIADFLFYKNQIILICHQGVRTNISIDADILIYILDLEGNLILKRNIGKSTGISTNMLLINDSIYFGFLKSSSIAFGDFYKNGITIITKLNLFDNNIENYEYTLERSYPKFLVNNNSSVYLIGEQYDETLNKKRIYSHSILSKELQNTNFINQYEKLNLKRVVFNNELFTILTYNSSDKQNLFINIFNLSKEGKFKERRNLNFKSLNWESISLYLPQIENKINFYVYKKNEMAFFVELNQMGNVISEKSIIYLDYPPKSYSKSGEELLLLTIDRDNTKVIKIN